MNRIVLAFVVVIGFGRIAFADDPPRVDVAFTGNQEHDQQAMATLQQAVNTGAPSVGVLYPIEMQNSQTAQQALSLVNQNLENNKQNAIAKAEREGYVLHMNGEMYGRPDLVEREQTWQEKSYVAPDGSEHGFMNQQGQRVTIEEYEAEGRAMTEKMIAQVRAWSEDLTRTVSDKTLLAELERGRAEWETRLRSDDDASVSKLKALALKRKAQFAVPSSWSAEKINVYNQAMNYGITLFQNEDEKQKGSVVESNKNNEQAAKSEVVKPQANTPKVLVSG